MMISVSHAQYVRRWDSSHTVDANYTQLVSYFEYFEAKAEAAFELILTLVSEFLGPDNEVHLTNVKIKLAQEGREEIIRRAEDLLADLDLSGNKLAAARMAQVLDALRD